MSSTLSKITPRQDLMAFLKNKSGYLPNQLIEQAYHEGYIRSAAPVLQTQFQPVSLDLRLGYQAYRIQCSFLPENEIVEDKLKTVSLYEFDITNGGILEKGAIYLIPLLEELSLPSSLFGLANPKSSTGRLDVFTRVIVDQGHRFDEIPRGYNGKMYLEIIPRSFPIRVQAGLTLNQLRVCYSASRPLGRQALEPYYKNNPILFDRNGFAIPFSDVKIDYGLYLGVDLEGDDDGIAAYKAKTNSNIIDLTKINHYDPLDFWEPIYNPRNNRLILEPECFYIMMSRERVCIRPDLLAEMIPYEPNSGELRTHYAGFFDPGFGWGDSGSHLGTGTHAVLEVRPHDVPFLVEHGQTFCRLKFEKVADEPNKVYGKSLNSNYHSQKLTLSKYFKS